jgi:hypothetical protein
MVSSIALVRRSQGAATLARQDVVGDRWASPGGDVADQVVQFEIHLIRHLLFVVHVTPGHLREITPMPENRMLRRDRLFRSERSAEQTDRMEMLRPWAVRNFRLACRRILTPIDLENSEPSRASRIWIQYTQGTPSPPFGCCGLSAKPQRPAGQEVV